MFKWKYFWPYLLFAGTIVALVIANSINIQHEIDRNLSYTKTLNVAGRQRMLSQKLTKLSLEARQGERVQQEISRTLSQWQAAHTSLKNSSDGLSIYTEQHPEVTTMFDYIDEPYSKLVNSFSKVAAGDISVETVTDIKQQEPLYLQQMEGIVRELEANASEDLSASRRLQTWLAIISGLVLLLEMLIFVYPYHKRLVNAYKKVNRQQDELQQQKEQIEHLYETNELIIKGTNAGIWEWNVITGEENWTDRFFELMQYERGDIEPTYNTFLNVLLHPDDKPKIVNAVEEHLKNKTPYKHEIRMLNKDGSYRWYETSGQAIWDEEGNALRMAGSIIDIEDRRATREKMLQENNAKNRILSIVAHDLRSPINNLISLIDMLKSNIIDKDEFLEYIDTVSDNVNAMSDSLTNILQWAQTQSKGWKVNPSDIKIDDVVQQCLQLYNTKMGEKDIEVIYEPDDYLNGYADFNQVVLIVRNILNNAMKFTHEKGTITIDVKKNGRYAAITVTDTGNGMDEETLEKVLSSKHMYTTKGTNGEKGTGLGMNMCFEFAEKNNCKLEIQSKAGAGTTVSLLIPQPSVSRKIIPLSA